jgi:hypothetical protein
MLAFEGKCSVQKDTKLKKYLQNFQLLISSLTAVLHNIFLLRKPNKPNNESYT